MAEAGDRYERLWPVAGSPATPWCRSQPGPAGPSRCGDPKARTSPRCSGWAASAETPGLCCDGEASDRGALAHGVHPTPNKSLSCPQIGFERLRGDT
jgi:hypothetical protein